mgnify:CR=1 FL=1
MKKIVLSLAVIFAFALTADAQIKGKAKLKEKPKTQKIDPKLKKAANNQIKKQAEAKSNEKKSSDESKTTKVNIKATDVKKAKNAKGKLKKK